MNEDFMVQNNIQGYIGIAQEDSISRRRIILQDILPYIVPFANIDNVSSSDDNNNSGLAPFPDSKRIIGIPEIVIVPYVKVVHKTRNYFKKYATDVVNVVDIIQEVKASKKVDGSVDIESLVKNTQVFMNSIQSSVARSKQLPIAHIMKDYIRDIDPFLQKYVYGDIFSLNPLHDYDYKNENVVKQFQDIIMNAEDVDVDFLSTYTDENSDKVCAFETVLFHMQNQNKEIKGLDKLKETLISGIFEKQNKGQEQLRSVKKRRLFGGSNRFKSNIKHHQVNKEKKHKTLKRKRNHTSNNKAKQMKGGSIHTITERVITMFRNSQKNSNLLNKSTYPIEVNKVPLSQQGQQGQQRQPLQRHTNQAYTAVTNFGMPIVIISSKVKFP